MHHYHSSFLFSLQELAYNFSIIRPTSEGPSVHFTKAPFVVPSEFIPSQERLSRGYSVALYFQRELTEG